MSQVRIIEKLTGNQMDALKALPDLIQYGFTRELLIKWQGMFYFEHSDALAFLVGEKNWEPEKAIVEVSNLDRDQALGISKGLLKKDLIGLNAYLISAVAELGLKVEEARAWRGHNFSFSHYETLKYLVNTIKLTPAEGIAELMELNERQSEAIMAGYRRCDVIDLESDMVRTLIKLAGKITASELRAWKSGGDTFYSSHTNALIYLINELKMSGDKAVEEINELNSEEAGGIAKGLSRGEVKGLKEGQIEALLELRKKGINTLTSDHLRQWQGIYFSRSHYHALVSMIAARHLEPLAAVMQLNNLDEFEADMIAKHQLSHHEVVGMNGWMIDVYLQLREYGLSADQIRSCRCKEEGRSFLSEYYRAFIYLIKENGMSAEKAVEEIKGLSDEQAKLIVQGKSREDIERMSLSKKI